MQAFYFCIIVASFSFGFVIAESNDSQSQLFVPLINGAFQHNFNVAERTSRQLGPILTVTKSTTVIVACAKIVNVTGPCRRRRGYWKEDPIVLTFDEETEKLTEILFTPVYSIEKTELPRLTLSDRVVRSVLSDSDTSVDDGRLTSSISIASGQIVPFQSRVYFQELFYYLGQLFSAFLPIKKPSSTSTTLSTSTSSTQSISSTISTQTTTIATDTTLSTSSYYTQNDLIPQIITVTLDDWITVTSTNTFFVQQCTPSPFPFSECLNSRRYSQAPAH